MPKSANMTFFMILLCSKILRFNQFEHVHFLKISTSTVLLFNIHHTHKCTNRCVKLYKLNIDELKWYRLFVFILPYNLNCIKLKNQNF